MDEWATPPSPYSASSKDIATVKLIRPLSIPSFARLRPHLKSAALPTLHNVSNASSS